MNHRWWLALVPVGLAPLALIVTVTLGAMLVLVGAVGSSSGALSGLMALGSNGSCVRPISDDRGGGPGGGQGQFTQTQVGYARLIIGVGKGLGLPEHAWVVALTTGLTESRLLNYANINVPESLEYPHDAVGSDHDSVGIFQQRVGSGYWGTLAQLMDPRYATWRFYKELHKKVISVDPNWQQRPIAEVAQTVQVSALPWAYTEWIDEARYLLRTNRDADPVDTSDLGRLPDDGPGADGPGFGGGCTGPLPGSGSWVVPVTGTLTSTFGPRRGGFHDGVDIAGPIGTPIHAASSGVVIAAGPASGYGLWVRIQHANNVVTEYGHVHSIAVEVGQRVKAGQQIATRGNRGQSTGPHLHFEVQINGKAVPPIEFYRDKGVQLIPGRSS